MQWSIISKYWIKLEKSLNSLQKICSEWFEKHICSMIFFSIFSINASSDILGVFKTFMLHYYKSEQ